MLHLAASLYCFCRQRQSDCTNGINGNSLRRSSHSTKSLIILPPISNTCHIVRNTCIFRQSFSFQPCRFTVLWSRKSRTRNNAAVHHTTGGLCIDISRHFRNSTTEDLFPDLYDVISYAATTGDCPVRPVAMDAIGRGHRNCRRP